MPQFSGGHHTGAVGDLPPLEEPGGARAAMARVMKPAGRAYSGGGTTGDGDPCPLVPEHGKMESINGSTPPKQWCPHQSHDGKGKEPGTRAMWPQQGLAAAVAEYRGGHA